MTARGAVLAMFALFFLGMLAAGSLHLGVLTGLSFVAGSALAARYTRREGLLAVVVTPPLIFLVALVAFEAFTSHADTTKHALTSAAEGVILTLAAVAPWLSAGPSTRWMCSGASPVVPTISSWPSWPISRMS